MRSSLLSLSLLAAMAAVGTQFFILAGPAFGAKSASIRLPEDFSRTSTRLELVGFSGFNRGRYSGGDNQGEFTRIESRLGIFDPLYVANKGKSSFTIENAAGTILVAASCDAVERTVSYRFVTFDLDKLSYRCDFGRTDVPSDAYFVLGEPKREGLRQKLLARDLRSGEASIGGQVFVFESVHEYQTGRFTSQTALGYLIESNGAIVAAVDLLDWNPVVHLAQDLSPEGRLRATTVALALAVLRDPADSALGD